MAEGYLQFHEQGQGRALIELATQYPPKSAVREFVTNSLDARIQNKVEDIVIVVNPSERRLIISDNGTGMTNEKLAELSRSIGYSEKAGSIDMRGEKALGLLAFGSLGKALNIISRPDINGNTKNPFGYLRWEINESKEKISYDLKKLTPETIQTDFYGVFPHGTRVIVDRVDQHIINDILTIANLKNWLVSIYNPALRNGLVNMNLGRLNRRGDYQVERLIAAEYTRKSSSELLDEKVSIDIKGEEHQGILELLLFIDPEAAYDKVAVYSRDVLVYESLAELLEFNKSPVFTSGKVSGYINDRFNKLVLGREGIDRKRNAFKAWYQALRELEEKLRPIVEEKKKQGKKVKEIESIRRAFDAVSDALRDIKKEDLGEEYIRSADGELIPVIGTEPTKIRKKGKKGVRGPPTGRPPGGGAFRYDPSGIPQRVVSRSGVPFGFPQPIEFPFDEAHKRSKLEDLLGSPTLYLNSAHEDYESRAKLKETDIHTKYIIELIAKETAFYSIRKAEREGRLVGEKVEIVEKALQEEERIKFLALKRLGLK